MDQDESFGIIPLTKQSGFWEVFLVQHKHGRYWGFPKGHAEKGETPEQAALRELKEETNLEVERFLQEQPLTESYRFTVGPRRVFKKVFYYIAEVYGQVQLQKNEIQNGQWVRFPEAIAQVTHPEAKSILLRVEKILVNM